MCSQIRRFCRHTALLLMLSVQLLCGLSCARHSRPQFIPTPMPPAAVSHPATAPPHLLLPIAFPAFNTGEISSLAFSPDGRRLAFGYGRDAEVTLWNLQTGRLAWQRHIDAASGGPIRFDPHGQFLVAQFDDPDSDVPVIVRTVGGRLIQSLSRFASGETVLFESSHFLVTSGFQEGITGGNRQPNAAPATEVWNTRTWRETDRAPAALNGFVPLTVSGKIIRHRKTKKPAEPWQPPSALSAYTASSADSRFLVIADEKRLEVWDVRSRNRLWTRPLTKDTPRALAISPRGQILAAATLGGFVYFWNLKTGGLLARTHGATDVLRCLAFSPNGCVLAVAGGMEYPNGDGVRLLDTATYKVFAVLKAAFPRAGNQNRKDWSADHPDWLASLPDLSYVASPSVVKKIRMPRRLRNAAVIERSHRPVRIRATLRRCWASR